MAAKKGGLGKGLDSLLVNKVNKTEAAEQCVQLDYLPGQ